MFLAYQARVKTHHSGPYIFLLLYIFMWGYYNRSYLQVQADQFHVAGPVNRLLAFSASSQSFHRFNSERQTIVAYSTSKQKHWQLLPQKDRETERRNLPFSRSNSSRLMLVGQQELFAKGPEYVLTRARFSSPMLWKYVYEYVQ